MKWFVNSDGQWLLSFYKIVTHSVSQSVTFVFQGSVCSEAATDQKYKLKLNKMLMLLVAN